MAADARAAAIAALSICESLLLALEANGVLSRAEIDALLTDAETTLNQAGPESTPDVTAAGNLVSRIREGKNNR
ncbi:hypothetical protein DUT91_17440 [Phyllobacterium salinisoli]|uniref:Uncharacterized protein n=1 Tax=Phyllobacterium salinisoli TaxID=1899321 RepID=A0A368K0B0_9HYPH|nr:hypothetical protein [Phyllobacterium salinisoli]RCS22661.1 hypothetical protein DUT91_17440 [Phyllobacterium salinisoli]